MEEKLKYKIKIIITLILQNSILFCQDVDSLKYYIFGNKPIVSYEKSILDTFRSPSQKGVIINGSDISKDGKIIGINLPVSINNSKRILKNWRINNQFEKLDSIYRIYYDYRLYFDSTWDTRFGSMTTKYEEHKKLVEEFYKYFLKQTIVEHAINSDEYNLLKDFYLASSCHLESKKLKKRKINSNNYDTSINQGQFDCYTLNSIKYDSIMAIWGLNEKLKIDQTFQRQLIIELLQDEYINYSNEIYNDIKKFKEQKSDCLSNELSGFIYSHLNYLGRTDIQIIDSSILQEAIIENFNTYKLNYPIANILIKTANNSLFESIYIASVNESNISDWIATGVLKSFKHGPEFLTELAIRHLNNCNLKKFNHFIRYVDLNKENVKIILNNLDKCLIENESDKEQVNNFIKHFKNYKFELN
ncbi:MAG: hypothetical protein HOP11_02845 [Saprospiraceae bacterium]|nr:hypothetical protein [Saprospiraceae bacterium]NOT36298.1 hypothetical protein [Saprospiraceae bacterium]